MAPEHSQHSIQSEIQKLREEVALLQWKNEKLTEDNEKLAQENVSLHSEIEYMFQQANGTDLARPSDGAAASWQSSNFGSTLQYWQHREQAALEAEHEWQGELNHHGWSEDDNDQATGEAGKSAEEQSHQEGVPAATYHWYSEYDEANGEHRGPDVLDAKPDNLVCTACIEWEAKQKAIEQELCTDAQAAFLDQDFFNTPAALVWLSREDQYSALHRAHQIAKQAFWYAYRDHWPEKALDKFPWHWDQVRFGTTEIEYSGLGTKVYPDASLAMCEETRGTIYYSMSLVTDLRNAVCHPAGPLTVGQICSLAGKAEKLAKLLGDRARVHELRLLRRDVMRKAQDVYKQIEASMGTAWCTGPRYTDTALQRRARRAFIHGVEPAAQVSMDNAPWPFHIQYLLQQVTHGLARDRHVREKFEAYPHGIIEAAKLWAAKNFRPGEDDPDYQERVQAARERVKYAATQSSVVQADPAQQDTSETVAEPCTDTSSESQFPAASTDAYSRWLWSHHEQQREK